MRSSMPSIMSELKAPGAMALTLMLNLAHSTASTSLSRITPASVLCGRSGLSTFITTGSPSASAAATASSAVCTSFSPTTGTPYSASTSFASRSVSVSFAAPAINFAAAAFALSGANRRAAATGAWRLSSRHIHASIVANRLFIERNSDTLRELSISFMPGPPIHSLSQPMQIGLPLLPASSSNTAIRPSVGRYEYGCGTISAA